MTVRTVYAREVAARPRTLEFSVSLDERWAATSDRGGAALEAAEAWTPEHLVLTALCRCLLTSLDYHLGRAGLAGRSHASARGSVSRRESDGRFAFVEIAVDVAVEIPADAARARELAEKAERGCFVGASLTAPPTYRWTVNGEELR